MIHNPAREFTSVTISCFDVALDVLWEELELLFMEHRLDVSGQRGRLNYEDFGPSPARGGTIPSKGGLFVPGRSAAPCCAVITNLVDGWQTLGNAASGRLKCSCWRFTVANDQEYPRNAFTFMSEGSVQRTVSGQLDTHWVSLRRVK